MTLSSLLPLAGAAITPTLGRVVDSVAGGLSFLNVLHKPEPESATDEVQTAEASTLEQNLTELADRLRQRFAQLGIDLTTPLRLKQDGRDRVVVDGDHPDRVLVESLLRDDPELTSLFHEVGNAAVRDRDDTSSGITKEFRFVLTPAGAAIEFV